MGGTRPLEISNRYRPDVEPDARELLAWALAQALGYDLPEALPVPMVVVI